MSLFISGRPLVNLNSGGSFIHSTTDPCEMSPPKQIFAYCDN